MMQNEIFRMKTDGFRAELFHPGQDNYPGKALVCFGGSDGKFELARRLAAVFQVREVTMFDLYLPMVRHPAPEAEIRVENITGPILLISSKMDTMWPSEPAAERIMERLGEKNFPYPYQHLSYDYGSHLFVPMEVGLAKFFRGDRGKYKEPGRRARMDSLEKTLEFATQW